MEPGPGLRSTKRSQPRGTKFQEWGQDQRQGQGSEGRCFGICSRFWRSYGKKQDQPPEQKPNSRKAEHKER